MPLAPQKWRLPLLMAWSLLTPTLANANAEGRTEVRSPFGLFGVVTLEFAEFQNDMNQDDAEFIQWAADRYLDLGARYSRQNTLLAWEQIEPNLGKGYTWSCGTGTTLCGPDPILKEGYSTIGKDKLDMVMVINPRRGTSMDISSSNLTRFKNFVKAAVERYDGDGVDDAEGEIRVSTWQAFNEPFDAWVEQGGTYEGYVTFVRATAEAVRAADPTARVMLGAILSTTQGRLDRNARNVISRLRHENAFDIVDIHHWGDKDDWHMDSSDTLRRLLDRTGYEQAEIWSTETGTFAGTATEVAGTQSESDQAASLVKRFVHNLAHGVNKVFWNNLLDWRCFNGSCGSQYDNMGLVSDGSAAGEEAFNPGAPRLAYYAYKYLAETLGEERDLEVVSETATDFVYAFHPTDGGPPTYVAWRQPGVDSESETGNVTFAVTGATQFTKVQSVPDATYGSTLRAADYPGFFKSATAAVGNGEVSINLGTVPVYLIP